MSFSFFYCFGKWILFIIQYVIKRNHHTGVKIKLHSTGRQQPLKMLTHVVVSFNYSLTSKKLALISESDWILNRDERFRNFDFSLRVRKSMELER